MSWSGFSSNSDNPYASGGRVILLFLLFLLSLYSMSKSGLQGLAITFGALPVMGLIIAAGLHWKMSTFWTLWCVNYLVFFLGRMGFYPGPLSLPNEIFEMILIGMAIIDAGIMRFEKIANIMGMAMLIWLSYCILEVINNTCGLGFNFGVWYTGFRLIALQLFYAFLVCSIYIEKATHLKTMLYLWASLALFASVWCLKQEYFGFTGPEVDFMAMVARTHMVNGIIRYFSIFSDAANNGITMAATGALFFIVAFTSKLKREKLFFLIVALFCTKAMFASGTRTAMFCLIAAFMVFVVLSKNIKLAGAITAAGLLFVGMLMFTNIGNGNAQIRRMRSSFNTKDASANTRKINQAVIAKYMKDVPWGIGIGVDYSNVPHNNQYRTLATIPPDSEYVYIWVHTGPIGITIFIICTLMMWLGACCVVFFKLKNRALHGIGAGLCSAFVAYQIGGYGNQILMQFPNVLLYYGGLAIVFALPKMEQEFIENEERHYQLQLERQRQKEEKKRNSRV